MGKDEEPLPGTRRRYKEADPAPRAAPLSSDPSPRHRKRSRSRHDRGGRRQDDAKRRSRSPWYNGNKRDSDKRSKPIKSSSSSSSPSPAKKVPARKSAFTAAPEAGAVANFAKPSLFKRSLIISKAGSKILMKCANDGLKGLHQVLGCSIRVSNCDAQMTEFQLGGDYE